MMYNALSQIKKRFIDKLTFELIEKHIIKKGSFDNILNANHSIPTHWCI